MHTVASHYPENLGESQNYYSFQKLNPFSFKESIISVHNCSSKVLYRKSSKPDFVMSPPLPFCNFGLKYQHLCQAFINMFQPLFGKCGLSFPRSTIILEYKLCDSCSSVIHTPLLSLLHSDLE